MKIYKGIGIDENYIDKDNNFKGVKIDLNGNTNINELLQCLQDNENTFQNLHINASGKYYNQIQSIEALGKGIENGGLSNLTSFKMDFQFNQIQSIEALGKGIENGGLSNLTSFEMGFYGNQIQSIEALGKGIENGGLSNLTSFEMGFYCNQIQSIEALGKGIENGGLSNLTSFEMGFYCNQIQSIGGLGKGIENGGLSNLTSFQMDFREQKNSNIDFSHYNIVIPQDKTLKLSQNGNTYKFIDKKIKIFPIKERLKKEIKEKSEKKLSKKEQKVIEKIDKKTIILDKESKENTDKKLKEKELTDQIDKKSTLIKEKKKERKQSEDDNLEILGKKIKIDDLNKQQQRIKNLTELLEQERQNYIEKLQNQNKQLKENEISQQKQIENLKEQEQKQHKLIEKLKGNEQNQQKLIEQLKRNEQNQLKQIEQLKKEKEKQLNDKQLIHNLEIQDLKEQNQQQGQFYQQKLKEKDDKLENKNRQIQKQENQISDNEQLIKQVFKDNEKLRQKIQEISDQDLPNFNTKKQEILYNWNMSKKHYYVDFKEFKDYMENYQIGDKIAKGSYGAVYKLQEKGKKNDDNLAVKILNEYDVKEVLTFQQINFLPKNLRKYIITTLGTYWDNEKSDIYIIQPQAECSLKKFIEKRKEKNYQFYKEQEFLFQFGSSLLGLVTLDIMGIAHRDIKQDNLLVMKDSSITIADLGEAKKLEHKVEESTLIKGTPQYWAPEMFKYYFELDQKNITEKDYSKCDLYAVGQCFLEATLLLKCVKADQLHFLVKPTMDQYQKERKQQHENIFIVLKNDPNQQNKVDKALKNLGLYEQKKNIPKCNPLLINLLEKILEPDPAKRISLPNCLEELLKIKDW